MLLFFQIMNSRGPNPVRKYWIKIQQSHYFLTLEIRRMQCAEVALVAKVCEILRLVYICNSKWFQFCIQHACQLSVLALLASFSTYFLWCQFSRNNINFVQYIGLNYELFDLSIPAQIFRLNDIDFRIINTCIEYWIYTEMVQIFESIPVEVAQIFESIPVEMVYNIGSIPIGPENPRNTTRKFSKFCFFIIFQENLFIRT